MTRLTRQEFLQRFEGQSLSLQQLTGAQGAPPGVVDNLGAVDGNGDRVLEGRAELGLLFDLLEQHGGVDLGTQQQPSPLARWLEVGRTRPEHSAEGGTTGTPLQRLLERNPHLRTNQDLINHILDSVGGDWPRGQRLARTLGVDLNALVAQRDAPLEGTSAAAGGAQAGADPALLELCRCNPALRTNQDLINHFMRAAAYRWADAVQLARNYGVDLNGLVENRSAPIAWGPETPPSREPMFSPEVMEAALATEPPSGALYDVWVANEQAAQRAELSLTPQHRTELAAIVRHFEQHRERYEAVAQATGIPAELILAIHYRESSLNFGTYLHQGDPLGRPPVHHPTQIPTFYEWEAAAIHALQGKDAIRLAVGLDLTSTNPVAVATFAERYNGLGYHYRGRPSPYVWGGTNIYQGGHFVRDGVFDARSWDHRLGVMAIWAAVRGVDVSGPTVAHRSPEEAWREVREEAEVLRLGFRTEAVTYLQGALQGLGYEVETDGIFGPTTEEAVRAFQRQHELEPDGTVGAETAAALDRALGEAPSLEEVIAAAEAP